MSAPEMATATRLAAANVGTLGTDLFVGPVRKPGAGVPVDAVFVLPQPGRAPRPYLDGGAGGQIRLPSIQVRTRSRPDAFQSGLTKARNAYNALHLQSLTGFLECRANESEPIYIGPDASDNHEWSSNFTLWREER